jgi:hypothetical protein
MLNARIVSTIATKASACPNAANITTALPYCANDMILPKAGCVGKEPLSRTEITPINIHSVAKASQKIV